MDINVVAASLSRVKSGDGNGFQKRSTSSCLWQNSLCSWLSCITCMPVSQNSSLAAIWAHVYIFKHGAVSNTTFCTLECSVGLNLLEFLLIRPVVALLKGGKDFCSISIRSLLVSHFFSSCHWINPLGEGECCIVGSRNRHGTYRHSIQQDCAYSWLNNTAHSWEIKAL